MLRMIGIVVTIALGDSLNPSTIAPGLYVASGERARRRVLEFTIAVFVVHLAGGAIILIGPGQLFLSLRRGLGTTVRDVLEFAAGIAMIAASMILWHRRHRLSEKDLPDPSPKRRSSALLGVSIIAVELPTAFPYFAAIAAILGYGVAAAGQLTGLALYNVCFVLPLIAILAVLLTAGRRADDVLERGRHLLHQRWPAILAGLVLITGTALTILRSSPGRRGRRSRGDLPQRAALDPGGRRRRDA